MVRLFPFVDDCSTLTPVEISLVTSVSITGPRRPPPILKVKPKDSATFNSVPLLSVDEFSFVKLNEEPFSMVAELPEPGGSLNTKSGISGPAVTNV